MNIKQKYKINYSLKLALYFFFLSFLGLIFLLIMVLTRYFPFNGTNPFLQNIFLFIYMSICIMGILAGLVPAKCSKILNFQYKHKSNILKSDLNIEDHEKTLEIKGHHPICKKFENHVFNFNSNTYCAGCTGLVIGAVISIILVIIGFFRVYTPYYLGLMFFSGLIFEFASLIYFMVISNSINIFKLFFNILFVLAYSLIFLAVLFLYQSLVLYLYAILMVFILVITRSTISRYKHQKICDQCDYRECPLSFS